MDTHILEKIGLTKGEIRVYLALIELGLSSTGPIIDKSHITSSKVYQILEKLEQKGLVSHVIKNNIRHFQAANPERIITFMHEKIAEMKHDTEIVRNLIPDLNKHLEQFDEVQETTMYQGSKGFQTARDEFISDLSKNKEYCVFGSENPLTEVYKNNILQFNRDNEKKGIKTRLIYHIKNKEVKELYAGFKITDVKFVSSHVPSSVAISKTKVLLMAYGNNPVQVLIKSKNMAESFLRFFEEVWKQAKK